MRIEASRRGAVLLLVLWVVVGAGTLCAMLVATARESNAITRNRLDFQQALWAAEGCLQLMQWQLAEVGANDSEGRALEEAWRSIDSLLESPDVLRDPACRMQASPVGNALDVNRASLRELQAALRLIVPSPASADSMAAALLDWRDADDSAQVGGAEREVYRTHGRIGPRNAPLAALEELRRVRGFETVEGLERYLTVEPGVVSPALAPPELLAALGLESERAWMSTATAGPAGWVVQSSVPAAGAKVRAVVEVRLALSGRRVALVRRRIWWG